MRTAFCLAITVAAGVLPAAQAQETRPTLAKAAETGSLRVSYRESSVPFSYLDNNKPVGFAMDLCGHIVEAVKTRLKKPDLKVEMQPVTSANRIPLVVNGTVDLECGSTTNNTVRREQVEFAINHFYTGTRLLVKKASGIKNWPDLKGKKVATTTGTTNFQVLRKYGQEMKLDLEVISGKDHADSMLLVDSDRAVAFGMDDILLYGLMANAKNPAEWDVVGDPLQVEPYAIMLRKNDPEFKKLVDDTLKGVIASGEFEKLYKKWFQSPIPPRNVSLNVPMSEQLRQHLKTPTDKPAL
ncbi:transporter substrate-binding domain-containing protein [Ideonella sp. BN130291]|nr:transporter substrate-binding domain-containing protein [Ideonella sp. BN130291]